MVNGKLEITESFLVSAVLGTGAASASTDDNNRLKVGDTFKSITVDGETTALTRRYQLNDLMLKIRKGDKVVFGIIRDGVETDITIDFNSDDYFVIYQ